MREKAGRDGQPERLESPSGDAGEDHDGLDLQRRRG